MTHTRVLWAVKVGDPDWAEVLITENPDRIEDARLWAEANGFDRLREATIDLTTPPDFKRTINQ